jgi:hypothetical protein
LPADVAKALSPRNISGSVRLTRPEISFTKNARERSWKDAKESGESRTVDRARAWLYLSMSHALQSDEVKARRWLDRATELIQSIEAPNAELTTLRAQAEQFVGNRPTENQQ